jgi:hypothetical protein
VLLLAFVVPVFADEEEDQYFDVLGIIQKADALYNSGQVAKALTKYQEAQVALETFRKAHTDWNPKVIAYRAKYLADKIALCSDKSSQPAQKQAEPPENKAGPGTSPDNKSTGAETGVRVKLLEAGSEPRQVLRLHPKAEEKQTLTMTLKMAMAMKVGGMENPPMKLPTMVMTMEATVKNVSPEGDIAYEMVLTDTSIGDEPGVLPQVAETIKSSLGNIKGLSGKGVISDRGVNKGMEMTVPSGADPQVQQAMGQMRDSFANLATPLPEEGVGVGAKWEAKMPIKSQGMSIDQTTTYELVSLKDDNLATKININQTAPPQKVQSPSMGAMKLDLLKMSGTGTGEVSLGLGQLLPLAGTMVLHSDLAMGVGTGAQQQTMDMKMDIDLRLEAK